MFKLYYLKNYNIEFLDYKDYIDWNEYVKNLEENFDNIFFF